MKRLLILLAILALVPIAQAMPGDCYATCDIEQDCVNATDVCYECTVPYSDTECLQWRETTCQNAGACGQCTILSQWNGKSTGPWNYDKSFCYTKPNPDQVIDRYIRAHYIDTWQRQRCHGVERTVLVAQRLDYWELCTKQNSRGCITSDERITVASPYNCPF